MTSNDGPARSLTAFDSATFGQDGSFRVDRPVGSATISPCGRDVALASRQGLHIIDLDSPWSPPRNLAYHTPWEVADVQWSPFAARDYWVVSTSNQKALVWNLNMHSRQGSVEHVLHAHTRAISDINFSAHYPDILATCAVDSFVHCWDLRHPARPAMTFCDWFAGATQVKWNRTNPHILASSHDKFLHIWDDRKGTRPLRSIEAHDTKIYGVDWNRFKTTTLVTCSLDRTIKFWNYTEDTTEPEQILHTDFPVWRARHTPFGYGLLAMPQRGDNDLHLYDRRAGENAASRKWAKSVHTFEGHHGQVKEFLWRPRGNVSATMDDRDYQLVSWGADRVLRLHRVTGDVLNSVGYQKGIEAKRTTGFTRKGAPYKTFRDAPSAEDTEMFLTAGGPFASRSGPTMRLPSAIGNGKSMAPFTGGKINRNPWGTSSAMKGNFSQDLDPISWMRGVKIGKRSTFEPGSRRSTSAVMSPTLKAQPVWDMYESLGEEITTVGDKFSKIRFENVDMHRQALVVSLPGPWGPDRASTYVRVKMEFPAGYPNIAMPAASIEKTTSLQDIILQQMTSDIHALASELLSVRRGSLEPILRYLLGEQSLDEILQSFKKYQASDKLLATQNDDDDDDDEDDDDEDDEGPGAYAQLQSDSIESVNPLAMVDNAQYNVPLPKACGALWAANGTLVCFFPTKLEKETSVLDQSFRVGSRNRGAISEGFGRLYEAIERRKGLASTLETVEDGGSEADEFETSSSDSSSSSNDIGLPPNHFLPAIAWRGGGLDMFQKMALDGSQKSVGDVGTANSTSSKGNMFISLHNLSEILPSKQSLAKVYEVGNTHQQAAHNASAARRYGYLDIADVWNLIGLMLQNEVPVQIMHHRPGNGSIFAIARHALSSLEQKDSGIDIDFDASDEDEPPSLLHQVSWGSHPFGQRWLVKALFTHFEKKADFQMLAMMSCIFSKYPDADANQDQDTLSSISPLKAFNNPSSYYPSTDVAMSLHGVSLQSSPSKFLSTTHSTTSSAGTSVNDQLAISYDSNTPPGYEALGMKSARRSSQTTSLSTSPEQHRHMMRSNSHLSAFAASFARPFSFNISAASSPPSSSQNKRASPPGSYLGQSQSSTNWTSTSMFSHAPTISQEPKTNISLSLSDTEDSFPHVATDTSTQARGFVTTLKNQDRFHNEGHAHLPLLDANKNARYAAYREAYSELLFAWDMPLARCEILKYNGGSSFSTDSSRFSQSIPTISHTRAKGTSLVFNAHCMSCSCLFSGKHPSSRCPNCLQASGPPTCLYCNIYIHGLASPCINCGHILHRSCRLIVLEMGFEECISGCGCICSDHPSIDMPRPESRTQRTEYGRDVSPAVTVIADSTVDEQEMAGWRGSEWEELAYQSLARNLRGERRGSERVVRERASSIWRGSSS